MSQPNNTSPIFDKGREDVIINDIKTNSKYRNGDYPIREEMLKIGDCIISGRVVIEIKRIKKPIFDKTNNRWLLHNDLRASIFDGTDRIHIQSKDRHDNYEINIMIIEIESGAPMFDDIFTKDNWDSLQKTLTLSFDTHIWITESQEETIDFIYSLWRKEKNGVKFISPINKEPKPKTLWEEQIYFLSGLINVGYKSAEELLEVFKTPIGIIHLIVTKTKYPGYGPKFYDNNMKLLCEYAKKDDKQ